MRAWLPMAGETCLPQPQSIHDLAPCLGAEVAVDVVRAILAQLDDVKYLHWRAGITSEGRLGVAATAGTRPVCKSGHDTIGLSKDVLSERHL